MRRKIANSKMHLVKLRQPVTLQDPYEGLDDDLLIRRAQHEGMSTSLFS